MDGAQFEAVGRLAYQCQSDNVAPDGKGAFGIGDSDVDMSQTGLGGNQKRGGDAGFGVEHLRYLRGRTRGPHGQSIIATKITPTSVLIKWTERDGLLPNRE